MKSSNSVKEAIDIVKQEYLSMLNKASNKETITNDYFDGCLYFFNTVTKGTMKMFKSEKTLYLTAKFQNIIATNEAYAFPQINDEYTDLKYQITILKKITEYLKIIKRYRDFNLLIMVASLLHTSLCMFHNRCEVLDSKMDYFTTRKNLYNSNLSSVSYYTPIVSNDSSSYKPIIEEQLNVLELIKANRK